MKGEAAGSGALNFLFFGPTPWQSGSMMAQSCTSRRCLTNSLGNASQVVPGKCTTRHLARCCLKETVNSCPS